MKLKRTFIDLCLKYSNNSKLIESSWNEIKSHYTSRNRHYHGLVHLEFIINELLEVNNQINNWDTILFSIFYHDIIYKATSKINEELSAELAKERLSELAVPVLDVKVCFDALIATKHHHINKNKDINLFTDADLGILGVTNDIYKIYSKRIFNFSRLFIQ